jgi:hypothetical protein
MPHRNILVTEVKKGNFQFTLINQTPPMLYRRDYFQIIYKMYEEDEYEFNDVLVLKKLCSMLVTLATGEEPPDYSGMVEIL